MKNIFIFCLLLTASTNALSQQFNNVNKLFITEWLYSYNPQTSNKELDLIIETTITISKHKKLDPILVLSLIDYESKFNKYAVSKTGAKGLMQVIPSWHKDKIRGRNLFSIGPNLDVGTTILKDCLIKTKYNLDKTLKCYSGYNGLNVKTYIRQVKLRQSKYNAIALSDRVFDSNKVSLAFNKQ